VELMIRVAAGEALPLAQADVKLNGWAVESRVYAEDPYRNFLPSTGRLTRYRPPAETSQGGTTVRNDTGVTEGGEISIHYDPMIAKLVTHGPTRDAAVAAQSNALDAFVIDGIRQNIPFLSALMQHPRWHEGRLSTAFIAEEYPDGFHPVVPAGAPAETIAAVAASIDHVLGERKRRISGQMVGREVKRERRRAVRLGELWLTLEIMREARGIAVRFVGDDGAVGPARVLASVWVPGDPVWSGFVDGHAVAVQVRPVANGFSLSHRGVETNAYVYTQAEAASARLMPVKKPPDTGKVLLCPMPGLVRSIAVTEGQEVKTGEALAIIEAMKMENVLRAERDATVKAVRVKPGDSLAVDAVIIEFA
jgi:propionyl-CoA carboxylase alpha chain